MRRNLALGLPEAMPAREAKPTALTVVAAGPSAVEAPLDAEPTLALNNALSLFLERGLAPTYWAACDPQERVADFLPEDPPQETTYFVASKCHPKVFEKLNGRTVIVWHIDDAGLDLLVGRYAIPSAVSITLCALGLASMLGYRTMDVYGWDGCFVGDKHHARPQPLEPTPINVTFPDGRVFQTTATWAAEAQDAAAILAQASYTVSIKSEGFIKAMVEHDRQRIAA